MVTEIQNNNTHFLTDVNLIFYFLFSSLVQK